MEGLAIAPSAGRRAASDPVDARLFALAAARPELAWPATRDIAMARNAHYTNRRAELATALLGDFDWLEGDVRADSTGRAVMQHAIKDPVDLDLRGWLAIVLASGRGAKLDVKDSSALPAVLAAIRASGIPQHRLILNVGMWSTRDLLAIRRALPDVWINLSPSPKAMLTDAELATLQIAARLVGGRTMFPIRHDLVTERVVAALKPLGRVAVWNSPRMTNPSPSEPSRLRAIGVDGMIDLRGPASVLEHLESLLVRSATRIMGRQAVHDALDALGYI